MSFPDWRDMARDYDERFRALKPAKTPPRKFGPEHEHLGEACPCQRPVKPRCICKGGDAP